ncbi:Gfo/Idh/MocA family oxidoreductase [Klebsiella pneumoniae]|uniref:Gfo/Idh/MocA family oxidoreductase n=1 Tax=Klebsiella pneumoniae TaxID=573 RepID=UPI001ABC789D|nr:Gfo/Idh/MocA family oxidoreductase [Klebsiella pneumoniae]MBO3721282.1 Gfo/Idh/MocA family oxidoreductase [Klebsiella pneumoniae]HCM5830596.1 Gfo/Idh/MocA family oxidoreductase [Klebsiella pneumoniae]
MNKQVYNIAIIGFGGMGKEHCKKLSSVNCLNVIGAFDTDNAKHKEIQDRNIYLYKTFDQVLSDADVDAVLIATPNDSHHSIALAALNAGKHVICEKPAMLNSKELEDIIAVSKHNGKVFIVHQNRRWDEDYLVMKHILESGIIGNVIHIETRVQGSRGIPSDWRHLKSQGGGMLLDWGVHLVDRLLKMVPEKVSAVYANLSFVLGHDVDDGAKIFITFESGKTALVEIGTTNFITLPKWYMTGLGGTAVINDWMLNGEIVKLAHSDGTDAEPIEAGAGLTKTMAPRIDDSIVKLPLPRIETDVREFYVNFVSVINSTAEPIVKNAEVLRVMKLLECAVESHQRNAVMKFE